MYFRWNSRDRRCVGVAVIDEDGVFVAGVRDKNEAARAAAILTDLSVSSRGSHRSSTELHGVAMEVCRRQHGHEHYERIGDQRAVNDLVLAARQELQHGKN